MNRTSLKNLKRYFGNSSAKSNNSEINDNNGQNNPRMNSSNRNSKNISGLSNKSESQVRLLASAGLRARTGSSSGHEVLEKSPKTSRTQTSPHQSFEGNKDIYENGGAIFYQNRMDTLVRKNSLEDWDPGTPISPRGQSERIISKSIPMYNTDGDQKYNHERTSTVKTIKVKNLPTKFVTNNFQRTSHGSLRPAHSGHNHNHKIKENQNNAAFFKYPSNNDNNHHKGFTNIRGVNLSNGTKSIRTSSIDSLGNRGFGPVKIIHTNNSSSKSRRNSQKNNLNSPTKIVNIPNYLPVDERIQKVQMYSVPAPIVLKSSKSVNDHSNLCSDYSVPFETSFFSSSNGNNNNNLTDNKKSSPKLVKNHEVMSTPTVSINNNPVSSSKANLSSAAIAVSTTSTNKTNALNKSSTPSKTTKNLKQQDDILLKAIMLAKNNQKSSDLEAEFVPEGPPPNGLGIIAGSNGPIDTVSTSGISESSVVNYTPKPPPIPYESDSDSDADGPILYRDDPVHIQEKKKMELKQKELARVVGKQTQYPNGKPSANVGNTKNSNNGNTANPSKNNGNASITMAIHDNEEDDETEAGINSAWAAKVLRNDTVSRSLEQSIQQNINGSHLQNLNLSAQGLVNVNNQKTGTNNVPDRSIITTANNNNNDNNLVNNITLSTIQVQQKQSNQINNNNPNQIHQQTKTSKLKRNPDASFRKPNPQDQNIKIHLAREESQRRRKEISGILIRRLSQRPTQDELTDKNIYKDRSSNQTMNERKKEIRRELSRKLSIRPTLQDLIDKRIIFNEYVDIYDIESFDRRADKPWLRLTQYDKVSTLLYS